MDLAAAKFGEKRLRARWERHLDGRDSTHCSIHTQPAREGRINLALPAGARGAVVPSLSFLAVFFALPAVTLISYSLLTQSPQGTVRLPITSEHYRHFFGTPLYAHVLFT